jgi:molecular chaperone DnaK
VTEKVFGIDFGTTNSLAALVEGDRTLALVDRTTGRPHPSVIWYRGSEVVVGRLARQQMDLADGGAPPGFIRSPKSALRRDGPLYVEGRALDPVDAVAEVLRYVRMDAASVRGAARDGARGYALDRAVMTIPVDFGGIERRALRQAARKAGISIIQFVHEPAAALYAHLRSELAPGQTHSAQMSHLEGRTVLVFDWGGGTLDLTLCRLQGGSIIQIANVGLNDVGGDRFDERIRNLLRKKHARSHGLDDVTALEQPGMAAKLLHQCEIVKISLSDPKKDTEDVIVRDFLQVAGKARNLVASFSRRELDEETTDIVRRGLAAIDELLESANVSTQDIALCLATGGMTNMPAIRNGLTERFLGRVPRLPNGDRIIAEGAAWIAHDGVRLTLSKPIELLVADTSGFGTYHPLVLAGQQLPIENEVISVANLRLFCIDPREGRAMVEVVKPIKPGRTMVTDARKSICVGYVGVDSSAKPLIERINCQLQIDHDYVGKITLASTDDRSSFEFHDLEFGLSIGGPRQPKFDLHEGPPETPNRGSRQPKVLGSSNVVSRSNIAVLSEQISKRRQVVPGDLARRWWPYYFDVQSREPTSRQREEDDFYKECALCHRLPTHYRAEGCERCGILQRKA